MSNSYGIIVSIIEDRAISTDIENDIIDEYIKDERRIYATLSYVNISV